MKMIPKPAVAFAIALVLIPRAYSQALDPRWLFALGDSRFKDQKIEVAPGQIVSLETGKPIPFEDMIRELKPVPFILVGESHDSLPAHELQARIIRALYEQDARLAVGLEMVAAARQEILTRWSLGELTDEEFLRTSKWYSAWGFHFGYYRPILAFAKENRIPLYALDTPQEVVGQFQMRDGEILSGTGKSVAARIDPAEENDRLLLRKTLESSGMPAAFKAAVLDSMFEDLYRAAAVRDKDMGTRSTAIQKKDARKVVVLVGAGHLMFGLGLNRQVQEKSGLTAKGIVPVGIPKGMSSVTVSRTLADYIIGIPAEERPAYPEIGLTFKSPPDPIKLVIAAPPTKGAARGFDFRENDLILSVDDRTFPDAESLQIYLAGIPWGGQARFRILRQGIEQIVVLKITTT